MTAKPLEVDYVPEDNKRVVRMLKGGSVYYIGDGVYAALDSMGGVTLSTVRPEENGEHHEHFIILEPGVLSRLLALVGGES